MVYPVHRRRLGIALFAVAMGTNVSTPLLLTYQERLGLTNWTVTAIFAAYPLALAVALVIAGPASDVRGRRPVLVPGVVLSAVASGLFLLGRDTVWLLYAGRVVLGVVSGMVFVVASAWMQELSPDTEPLWPSRLTGMLLYAGFGFGPILSGVLGQWGPWPLILSYLIHISVIVVGLVAVLPVAETVTPSDRPIRVNLGIPPGTGRPFYSVVAPTALGVFGFASLSFGLFPVLLRPAMAGVAVFVTGLTAGITAFAIFGAQRMVSVYGPHRTAAIGYAAGALGTGLGAIGFATDLWGLLFPAAVLLGTASGCSLTSGLRFVDMLTARDTRGAMTGTFYAFAYGAMTMPVIITSISSTRSGIVTALTALTVLAILGTTWLWLRASLVTAQPTAAPTTVL